MKTRILYHYRMVARFENVAPVQLDLIPLEKAIQEAWREGCKPACTSAVVHRSVDGLKFLPFRTVK